MISEASKDVIATAATALAIQIGHYQRKFGVIPMDEAMDLLESKGLSEDESSWVADGLENLAVVLSSIKEDEPPPALNS